MVTIDLNFAKKKPIKCVHCKRIKGDHRAVTFQCPVGKKHRTFGWTSYHADNVFTEKL